jgi:hypothetical protein
MDEGGFAVIMLGVLAALVVLVSAVMWRMTRNAGSDNHGATSEQWLAEHRASHNRPFGE